SESINQVSPPGQVSEERLVLRSQAGNLYGIPFHPDIPKLMQFRAPIAFSKRMLETYARPVVHAKPPPQDPNIPVVSVKIYRVVHNLLTPKMVVEQIPPDAEWLYLPFYQGEFDMNGKLLDPDDPFLYWMIPIVRLKISADPKAAYFRGKVGGHED